MKAIVLVVILVLCFSQLSFAGNWTKEDTYLELLYFGVKTLDWRQTVYISNHPDRFHEINPLIGKHPSESKVNTYFAISSVVHLGVAYYLPKKLRKPFIVFTLAVSSYLVCHNASIGIKF